MIEANRTMRQPTAAQAAATASRGARQAIALRGPAARTDSVRDDAERAGQSLAGSGALVFEGEVLELPVLH
jgi:hypothetical protein